MLNIAQLFNVPKGISHSWTFPLEASRVPVTMKTKISQTWGDEMWGNEDGVPPQAEKHWAEMTPDILNYHYNSYTYNILCHAVMKLFIYS